MSVWCTTLPTPGHSRQRPRDDILLTLSEVCCSPPTARSGRVGARFTARFGGFVAELTDGAGPPDAQPPEDHRFRHPTSYILRGASSVGCRAWIHASPAPRPPALV